MVNATISDASERLRVVGVVVFAVDIIFIGVDKKRLFMFGQHCGTWYLCSCRARHQLVASDS